MVDIARVSLARIRNPTNPTKTEAFLPDHPILTESVSELLKKERTNEKKGSENRIHHEENFSLRMRGIRVYEIWSPKLEEESRL